MFHTWPGHTKTNAFAACISIRQGIEERKEGRKGDIVRYKDEGKLEGKRGNGRTRGGGEGKQTERLGKEEGTFVNVAAIKTTPFSLSVPLSITLLSSPLPFPSLHLLHSLCHESGGEKSTFVKADVKGMTPA